MPSKKKEPDLEPFETVIEWEPEKIKEYLKGNWQRFTSFYSADEKTALLARAEDDLYTDADKKPNTTRRQLWTANHGNIMNFIARCLDDRGYMPTVMQIAEETKLSRLTVTKHLKHFEREEYLSEHRQKWKLATERVLLKLSQYVFSSHVSYSDSTRAAAVYLKFADKFLHPVTPKAEEPGAKNFIQINNVYINQTTIQALPEEKRRLIETIILDQATGGVLEPVGKEQDKE